MPLFPFKRGKCIYESSDETHQVSNVRANVKGKVLFLYLNISQDILW